MPAICRCPVVLSPIFVLLFAFAVFAQAPQVQNPEPEVITFKVGTETFRTELVKIKAGKFMMGSSKEALKLMSDKFNYIPEDETEHEVEVSAFSMAKYKVTRSQFRLFTEDNGYETEAERGANVWGWDRTTSISTLRKGYNWKNPGFEQRADHPVLCVSWNDAQAYCAWLSKRSGKKVSLPSEAQWEYACRAGSKTLYFFGDNEEGLAKYANVADAWFQKETGISRGIKGDDGYAFTSPVGRFKGNPWGLYDMLGNAWEWCADYYRKDYERIVPKDQLKKNDYEEPIVRGAAWNSGPEDCRAALRVHNFPSMSNSAYSFRIVVLP